MPMLPCRSWICLSACTIAPLAIARPSWALQLQVTPTAPQLGDTLSVIVQTDAPTAQPPRVTLGDRTFATFAIGPNRFRALLPTTPLDRPGTLQIQAMASGSSSSTNVSLRGRSFPTQSIWLPPGQDGNVDDWEYDQVDAFKKLVTPEKLWRGPFLRPNSGPVTTIYGVRRYYNGEFANDYFHRGVDYAGPYGSPVVAPATGRVMFIGREAEGFKVHGNVIGLDHGQGVTSLYLHLSRINVSKGDLVQAGQVIGALGNTGASTGPHLHWGLYVNGQSVDPVPWRERGFD